MSCTLIYIPSVYITFCRHLVNTDGIIFIASFDLDGNVGVVMTEMRTKLAVLLVFILN